MIYGCNPSLSKSPKAHIIFHLKLLPIVSFFFFVFVLFSFSSKLPFRLTKNIFLSPLLVLFFLMGNLMTSFFLFTGRSLDCLLLEHGLMPHSLFCLLNTLHLCPFKLRGYFRGQIEEGEELRGNV